MSEDSQPEPSVASNLRAAKDQRHVATLTRGKVRVGQMGLQDVGVYGMVKDQRAIHCRKTTITIIAYDKENIEISQS